MYIYVLYEKWQTFLARCGIYVFRVLGQQRSVKLNDVIGTNFIGFYAKINELQPVVFYFGLNILAVEKCEIII